MLTAALSLAGLGVGVTLLFELPSEDGRERTVRVICWQLGAFVGGTLSLILLMWSRS
jgi:hypothetical protein